MNRMRPALPLLAGSDRAPSVASAVARFMVGSLVAIAIVVVGGFFAIRSIAVDEARRDTAERVQSLGQLVEAAGLSDGVHRGDAEALAQLDDLVLGTVLSGSIVRVKVWGADGTILYSDASELIGERFPLGEEELEVLREGGSEAELSDLSEPENRLERPAGKLLEAYTAIRTPDGTPVLFEIYQRFSSVNASGERLLRALAPPLLAGLLALALLQVPLAWSLARRLQRGRDEREALLTHAVDASNQERRRIASDLHDGVVQKLAGLAFGLSPLAQEAARDGRGSDAQVLNAATTELQQSVRELRTLLVEIHPPNLATAGLDAALHDLLSPLASAGVATELSVEPTAPTGADELAYRVVREALRNVASHAAATRVAVTVERLGEGGLRLTVADDGRGFAPDARPQAEADGHVGLRLLEAIVEERGGTLVVESTVGAGTTLTAEVPAR